MVCDRYSTEHIQRVKIEQKNTHTYNNLYIRKIYRDNYLSIEIQLEMKFV